MNILFFFGMDELIWRGKEKMYNNAVRLNNIQNCTEKLLKERLKLIFLTFAYVKSVNIKKNIMLQRENIR